MVSRALRLLIPVLAAMAAGAVPASLDAAPPLPGSFSWTTVVNNNDQMPGAPAGRTFNSYNPPSVNATGLVVLRARSKGGEGGGGTGEGGGGGGNQPTHGVYTRDMSATDGPVVRILDRKTVVPAPNNIQYPPGGMYTTFVETPSFPRIDIWSDTIATRGNHQPVWEYTAGSETRVGTTGIYANPFGGLVTGASKLGAVPGFDFFEVPGADPWTLFDVFPGAPSVTDGKTIVFKGNYTAGGKGRTGVFYRVLERDADYGGTSPVMLIANTTDTLVPGTRIPFGSTSPPSAAGHLAVFAGFDDEWNPSIGGLYMADLRKPKKLKRLVGIGERVPGEGLTDRFSRFGESVAFDGRYVGFWGAWGTTEADYRTVRLYCPAEGNKDRVAYCNGTLKCMDTGRIEKDPASVCNDPSDPQSLVRCYQDKKVPVRQGIFLHDTESGVTTPVAATGDAFDDFVFWNYSGRTPCAGSTGHGDEGSEDDGEPARWRSSSFVAVSGRAVAFKAARGGIEGIYLDHGSVRAVLDTTMKGRDLDPEAPPGSTITELGLEREGLRGDRLVVNAKMRVAGGTEDDGMAGIYLTLVPRTGSSQ